MSPLLCADDSRARIRSVFVALQRGYGWADANDVAAVDLCADAWPELARTSRSLGVSVDYSADARSASARNSRSLSAAVNFCAGSFLAPAKKFRLLDPSVNF